MVRTSLTLLLVTTAASLFWPTATAQAGRHHRAWQGCYSCGAAPVECGPTLAYQMVERTVLAPETTWETRLVDVTVCRPEVRHKVVNVTRLVPEQQEVQRTVVETEVQQRTRVESFPVRIPEWQNVDRQYTVRVPHWREVSTQYTVQVPTWREVQETRVVSVPVWREVPTQYTVRVPHVRDVPYSYTVMVPDWKQVPTSYTVMVPHQEMQQGTRRVCRPVVEQVMHTVTEDQGAWEERAATVAPCSNSCGYGCRHRRRCCYSPCPSYACAPAATCSYRVWVPNVVCRQVPVNVTRYEMQSEPYEYPVTVCRPEVRQGSRWVCSYRSEERQGVRQVCDWQDEVRQGTRRVCDWEERQQPYVRRICEMRADVRTRVDRVCDWTEEVRHETQRICMYRTEWRNRDVPYTVCVPRTRVVTEQITVMRPVVEPQDVSYTVMVPHVEQREVRVPVTQMVEKRVQCWELAPVSAGPQQGPSQAPEKAPVQAPSKAAPEAADVAPEA